MPAPAIHNTTPTSNRAAANFDPTAARSRYHTVKPGDTLESLSRLTGTPLATIKANNRHALGASGIVHPGMRILL
jgi:LysM repeat protein